MDIVGAIAEGAQMEPGYTQGAAADKIARELRQDDLPQLLPLLQHENERVVHMTAAVLMSNHLVQMLQNPNNFMMIMHRLLRVFESDSDLAKTQAAATIEACALIAPRQVLCEAVRAELHQGIERAATIVDSDVDRELLEQAARFV